MKRLVVVLAVLGMVSLALPVSAAQVSDPNDSSSKLDIAMVKTNGQDNELGTFVIRTYGRWSSKFLRDALPTTLKLYFDDGDDGDTDLVGNFRYKQGNLMVFLKGPDSGNHYEPVSVSRSSASSVKLRFPLDITEFESSTLSVFARSISSELSDCSGDPCRDRAPDAGGVTVY